MERSQTCIHSAEIQRNYRFRADTDRMNPTLQYGAGTRSLAEAAAPLREAAEKNGLTLRPALDVDLAAAAYGAEQWCKAFRTRTLDYPGVHGDEAVRSLAAILSRASGCRTPSSVIVPRLPQDDAWEALTVSLTEADRWDVVRRMISDLRYGNSVVLSDWLKLQLGSTTAAAVVTDGA